MDPFGIEKAHQASAAADPWKPDYEPTTGRETIRAMWDQTFREVQSVSDTRNRNKLWAERAKIIGQLGGDEGLASMYANSPFEWENQTDKLRSLEKRGELEESALWERMSNTSKASYIYTRKMEDRYPELVQSDDVLWNQFKKDSANARAYEDDIAARGPWWAALIGAGGAAMVDPMILSTLPFGGTLAAPGTAAIKTAATFAMKEAAIAGLSEIPVQAEVYRYKQELEAPWTVSNAVFNVAAATLGTAVFGGIMGGTGQTGRNLLEPRRKAARMRKLAEKLQEEMDSGTLQITPENKNNSFILLNAARVEESNPLVNNPSNRLSEPSQVERGATGPDAQPTYNATTAHHRALEIATLQAEAGERINVDDIVKPFEPADPINDAIRAMDDPTKVQQFGPGELGVDAVRMQFKTGGDEYGVTDALKGIEEYNARLANTILVWEDSAGKHWVVDGHQRYGLLMRQSAAGQDPAELKINAFVLREANGVSAGDARAIGAITNIAQGTGKPIDAAKVVRELGPAGMAKMPQLAPNSVFAKQVKGLARLSDENFMAVINDVIPHRYAALVGAATDDAGLQQAMIKVLQKTGPANETQARSIIAQVKAAGIETRTTSDLFGDQVVSESLYLERAKALDAVLKDLKKDKTVFGRLITEGERIESAGNKLDAEANVTKLEEARYAQTHIEALANTKGPISDALEAAAREIKNGAKPADVAPTVQAAIRREILRSNSGRPKAGGAEPAEIKPRAGSAPGKTGDLLGDNTETAQNIADEIARKNLQRNTGQDSLETGDPTDMFSQARNQVDIADTANKLDPEPGRIVRLYEVDKGELKDARAALIAQQAGRSVEDLAAAAEKNQVILVELAELAADEAGSSGVILKNPGPKTAKSINKKIATKAAAGKSATPDTFTDLARLGFITPGPKESDVIINSMGRGVALQDEGISMTPLGYFDGKALVRFADGGVGEVQIWDEALFYAKNDVGGESLYKAYGYNHEAMSKLEDAGKRKSPEFLAHGQALKELNELSAELYENALARATDEWRQSTWHLLKDEQRTRVSALIEAGPGDRVELGTRIQEALVRLHPEYKEKGKTLKILKDLDQSSGQGTGGASGKVTRKSDSEMGLPSSQTAGKEHFLQTGSSDSIQNASNSPRVTAPRTSQMNQSISSSLTGGIDSPPRAIIRNVVEENPNIAPGDATKTGFIPDSEYDAVMDQARALIDDVGELAQVSREIDGELIVRSARNAIEELDATERALNDIRICDLGGGK